MSARSVVTGALVGLGSMVFSAAADMLELKCSAGTCGYSGKLTIGPGRMFDQLTGYCARDREFVHLRWKRGEKAPDRSTVWNSKSGELSEVFKCPKCSDPVLAIRNAKDLAACPRCSQATLESKVVGFAD